MSAIRYTQTKEGWRLRPADLHDIDGLHALAGNPLVYRYLFDGAPPDNEFITRRVAESVANADTGEIVRWLASELSPDTYVNMMDQYYPAWKAKSEAKFSDINREMGESEFEQALACAREAGLWRLDRRWRPVRTRFAFVEIPPAAKRMTEARS